MGRAQDKVDTEFWKPIERRRVIMRKRTESMSQLRNRRIRSNGKNQRENNSENNFYTKEYNERNLIRKNVNEFAKHPNNTRRSNNSPSK
jgi:hypothetical protein